MVDRAAGRHPETVIREALTLAKDTPFGVPEAYLPALHRLDEIAPHALAALDSLARQHEQLREAATDPFLVILERHPNADPVANAEMKRAADRFRAALSAGGADTQENL